LKIKKLAHRAEGGKRTKILVLRMKPRGKKVDKLEKERSRGKGTPGPRGVRSNEKKGKQREKEVTDQRFVGIREGEGKKIGSPCIQKNNRKGEKRGEKEEDMTRKILGVG